MLDAVIRFSLRQRLLVFCITLVLMVLGLRDMAHLPIDVFPDLNRPRVVILTEAPGLAPEEIETLVNIPLEAVLNGATGVEVVRSAADIGLSVIFVEFDWGTDIYTDRQVVTERLAIVADRMPPGVRPSLAPISSLMGQIMMIGLTVEPAGNGPVAAAAENDDHSGQSPATGTPAPATSLLKLRQLADWVIKRRLMNISGVAQVFTMGGEGGGKRQVQVLVDPNQLRRTGVTLDQVEHALAAANENATGGYLVLGPNESLVRSLGRVHSLEDLELLVVDGKRQPPVLLRQVARVVNGPEIPRGTAAVNGQPAVMVIIAKQPGKDTRQLTADVDTALAELRSALPPDVRINTEIYRMESFIDRAIENVVDALRDGAILVVIVLFLFLLNFRTTFITLTAIPLSVIVTALVFARFGLSINTMTLGGLAVAIGELVDDAIVDVENIYRRLRENRLAGNPVPALKVVYQASLEVRSSIVYSTILVVLVFLPLFALHGMEGRLFAPLGMAYIVSILASLVVSLTVTPILSYWLLPNAKFMQREQEGWLLRVMRGLSGAAIRWSLAHPHLVLASVGALSLISVGIAASLGRNFLPPFNEGSVQVNVVLPAGTSLAESNRIGYQVDRALGELEDIQQLGRRTGRAEADEHGMGVNISESIVTLDPDSPRDREQQLDLIRDTLNKIPGVESTAGRSSTEQPLAHLMSHMVSGVKAQIAVKVYGDDLAALRNIAEQIRATIAGTPGVVDLQVEQQVLIPQLQFELNPLKLAQRGLQPGAVNHMIETAMNGRIVSQVLEGEAQFDLIVRLDDPFRTSLDALRNLSLELPSGGTVPLTDVATLLPNRAGPNQILREGGRRRIVIQCNASGRALSEVRDDIQNRLADIEAGLSQYGSGYYLEFAGQFESEQAATRQLGLLSVGVLAAMFLVLYSLFRSVNLALQVLSALPMAAIGAVAALLITRQSLSVPSLVGFISLAGIASRNGILLINHYLHLVHFEGEKFTKEMVIRAGQERVAPVLMTALTSGVGLIPLIIAGDDPGKEILYPVATVIVGGLISSTLLDFFVHPALFWLFGRKAAEVRESMGEEEM